MLFVTHYPPLADLEKLFPAHVANYHMSFLLHDHEEGKNQGNLKGEFVVAAILPSRMEVTYYTSGFVRS